MAIVYLQEPAQYSAAFNPIKLVVQTPKGRYDQLAKDLIREPDPAKQAAIRAEMASLEADKDQATLDLLRIIVYGNRISTANVDTTIERTPDKDGKAEIDLSYILRNSFQRVVDPLNDVVVRDYYLYASYAYGVGSQLRPSKIALNRILRLETLDLNQPGRVNLLDGSQETTIEAGGNTNKFIKFDMPIPVKVGDLLTFNAESIENLAGDASEYSVGIYEYTLNIALSPRYDINALNRSHTFTIVRADDTPVIALFAGVRAQTAGNTVKYTRFSLVRGGVPLAKWRPSPSEMRADIENNVVRGDGLVSSTPLVAYPGYPLVATVFYDQTGRKAKVFTGSASKESNLPSVPVDIVIATPDTAADALELSSGREWMVRYQVATGCLPVAPFYVRWMNHDGGWEHRMFERREESSDVEGVENIQRWTGAAPFSQITASVSFTRTIKVGEGLLDRPEYDRLLGIAVSPRIEWYNEQSGEWQSIVIAEDVSAVWDYRTAFGSMELVFRMPQITTQL